MSIYYDLNPRHEIPLPSDASGHVELPKLGDEAAGTDFLSGNPGELGVKSTVHVLLVEGNQG